MKTDKIDEAWNYVKERMSNPLVYSFLAAWLTFNWKIVICLIWYDTPMLKAEGCNTYNEFILHNIQKGYNFFIYPFCIALGYTIFFPLVKNLISAYNSWNFRWGNKLSLGLMNKGKISVDKYIKLRVLLEEKERILEERIESESENYTRYQEALNEKNRLETEVKNLTDKDYKLTKEYNELINKNQSSENRINSLSNDKEKLSDKLIDFHTTNKNLEKENSTLKDENNKASKDLIKASDERKISIKEKDEAIILLKDKESEIEKLKIEVKKLSLNHSTEEAKPKINFNYRDFPKVIQTNQKETIDASFIGSPKGTLACWVKVNPIQTYYEKFMNNEYVFSYATGNYKMLNGNYQNAFAICLTPDKYNTQQIKPTKLRWRIWTTNKDRQPFELSGPKLENEKSEWYHLMIRWNHQQPLLEFLINGKLVHSATNYLNEWPSINTQAEGFIGTWGTLSPIHYINVPIYRLATSKEFLKNEWVNGEMFNSPQLTSVDESSGA